MTIPASNSSYGHYWSGFISVIWSDIGQSVTTPTNHWHPGIKFSEKFIWPILDPSQALLAVAGVAHKLIGLFYKYELNLPIFAFSACFRLCVLWSCAFVTSLVFAGTNSNTPPTTDGLLATPKFTCLGVPITRRFAPGAACLLMSGWRLRYACFALALHLHVI
jgi:hypothetical protein